MSGYTPEKQRTILLVEDEMIIALSEALELQDAGYSVIQAACGEKAVEIVRTGQKPIDLILMDINLGPGMDGTETATEVLKIRDVPVLFLSSHTEKEIVEKTEKITSYGYVVKNSGTTVLDASIKMAFKLHEARRETEKTNAHLQAVNADLKRVKDELVYWNDLMEYVIRYDPSSIAVLDRNLTYRYVSEQFITDYRIAAKDVIGRGHYEIFPEIPERWKEIHRRGLSGETLRCDDDPFPRADGSVDRIRWEIRPWYEHGGAIGGIIIYSEVITLQKQFEEKLKNSDRVFNHALDMLCIAGFDGYFKVLNPSWTRTLGWSIEELLSKPWIEFTHPEDRQRTAEVRSVLIDGRDVYQFENRYLCKDGSVKWLSWNSYPYPEEGLLYGVARDVTEHRRIEVEINERRKLVEAVTATTPDILYLYSPKQQNHIFINRDVLSILGYSSSEILENGPALLLQNIHPDDYPAVRRHMEKMAAAADNDIHHLEYRIRNAEGRFIWFSVRERVYQRDRNNSPEVLFGVVQDVSARKEAEESQRQLLEQKTTLMQELTHRMKNNLNVVSSLLAMEASNLFDERDIQIFNDMRTRVETMASIYGKLHVSGYSTTIDLGENLQGICEAVFSTFNTSPERVSLQTDFASGVNLPMNRAVPLGLIANELITNSLKYGFPPGKIGEIRIGLEKAGNRITLRVSDNGIGLQEKKAGGSSSISGLTLIRALTAQIGGTFSIESAQGTTATIELES